MKCIYHFFFMLNAFRTRIFRLNQGHKDFPLFSSRSFILLPFKFRPMIYFELIFEYSVRQGLRFIFFPYGYLVIAAPYIEKIEFLIALCWCLCQKSHDHVYMCGSVSGLYSVALNCVSFIPVLYCLDYFRIIISLDIRLYKSSKSIFLF